MTKKLSKIMSLVIALLLCVAMVMPAMAIDGTTSGVGATVKVPVYLYVPKNVTNYPTTTVKIEVTAASVESGTNTYLVFAGNTTNLKMGVGSTATTQKTFENVTFTTGSAPTVVQGEKYGFKQEVAIDFSGVEFTTPGVYRYKITQTCTPCPTGITLDEYADRYLDVYVGYNVGTGNTGTNLVVLGTTLTKDVQDITQGNEGGTVNPDPANKSEGYEDEYGTHDVTVSKTVTGNQGSHTQEFTFTVEIEGLQQRIQFDIVFSGNADDNNGNSGFATSKKTVAAGEDGKSTTTITLKHGQSFTIKNLPDGASYTITETAIDGYKTTYKEYKLGSASETFQNATKYISSSDDDSQKENWNVDFFNDRQGVIPTGILLTIAPFAALMLVGVAGALFMVLKKKRS